MSIIAKERLSALATSQRSFKSSFQIINENKSQNQDSVDITIFLSHSYDDLKDGTVDQTIVFLRTLGIQVYIYSNDSSLPPLTNAHTAQALKNRIKSCKKFILLATNRAINSKWCNWELGYGDANKYLNNIALFPLADNFQTWQGSEFLSIYRLIEENFLANRVVIFPDGKNITLIEWLKL